MPHILNTILAIILIAALAMGFGFVFCRWSGLAGVAMREVLVIYAAATAAALVLFLAGHLFRIRSHAYYIVVGAAVFLAVDFLVWQRTGIMPHVKFGRGGFVPAAIIGMAAAVLYRLIAVRDAAAPDLR